MGIPEHLPTQRGASRLLNTLEEKLCRESTESRIVEDSVELCQVGIERVQGVHEGTLFRVQRGECQRKTPTKLLNTLVDR